MYIRWGVVAVTLLVLAGRGIALAQTLPLPPSADPARAGERLSAQPPPVVEQRESGPSAAASKAPEGAESYRFVLNDVTVEGTTVYSPSQLQEFYAAYLGKEVAVTTLYDIAAAITHAYHDDGYILARVAIPQQEIKDGKVRLQAIEGYIGEVTLQQGVERSGLLEEFLQEAKAMRPLHMPTLERMLLTLNDVSGIKVKAVLQPVENAQAGEVQLGVEVERKVLTGQFSLDDYGSRFIGPWQMNANMNFSDQLLPFDKISLRTLTTTETHEIRYGELGYSVPLNVYGTVASFTGSSSLARPGYTLLPFEIKSSSDLLRGELRHRFVHARDMIFSTSAGLEHKSTHTTLLGTQLYADRLTVATANANFSAADSWNGSSLADISVRHGLNILDTRKTGSVDLSRLQGRSDFTTINATLSRLQAIDGPWQLNVSANGQYAFTPLLASEEFGIGGPRYGRAYDPSEITGDRGVAGALELRYNALRFFEDSMSVMPFAYYDIGKVWNLDRGGDMQSLASAGVGIAPL